MGIEGKDEEIGGLDNDGTGGWIRAGDVTRKDRVRWNKKEWRKQKKSTFNREAEVREKRRGR